MPARHALIIGINRYPFSDEKYQLHGCVNDARLMRNILLTKFNFEEENIVSLHDAAATREAILAEMERLATSVQNDDIVVFHYSGHGHTCKVKTEFTDEGSGRENCILPTDDSEPDGDGGVIWREIRDHQFNDWLTRLARKTRYTTLIFDACHSATMTRSSPSATRVRGIPTEVRSQPATEGRSGAAVQKGNSGWLGLSDNYVVISGCRDTQTSKEKAFTIDGESIRHGVLSYSLTRALLGAGPGTTYRDVFESTCAGVVAHADRQNPQLEGAIDRELFGVRDIEPLRFIPLAAVDGDTVTLEGGAAHGLRRGSRWCAYPPGTKLADAVEPLAVLEVSRVGALESTATVIEEMGVLVAGARCVETRPAPAGDPLQVDLDGLDKRARASLEPLVRRSAELAVAKAAESADLHIRTVQSGGAPHWVVFDAEDNPRVPPHPVSEAGVTGLLVENLEKLARYRQVLGLDNPHSTLAGEFNLYKRPPEGEAGELALANGGLCEFGEDEGMVLEIINGESDRTLFFRIIWLSADGSISHFYPRRKTCEELSPGKTVRIGHGDRRLTASLGDAYAGDTGCETCKAIFSTTEADFSWLSQGALRSGASEDPPPSDWDAIGRSFILRRGTA